MQMINKESSAMQKDNLHQEKRVQTRFLSLKIANFVTKMGFQWILLPYRSK